MKKFYYGIIIVLTLFIAIVIYGSFYLLNYSLKPENHGQNIEGSYKYLFDQYPYMKPWVDSLNNIHALRDTFIYAEDGIRLHAYHVKAAEPTGKTAIIIHGYSGNAVQMFMLGHMYNHTLGYNILLPDLRYSGLSGGNHIQMGWKDRLDILHWMNVTKGIYGDSIQLAVHGISMGGATTMMVSGETLPENVKCFIEDCGYTDVWDEFKHQLKDQFGLPAFPLMNVASDICKLKYGWGFKEASSIKQVEKCNLPMLFIHGDQDDFVPTRMVYELYDSKSDPKELWIVKGATHGTSFKENPEEYTQRVRAFTDKYIR